MTGAALLPVQVADRVVVHLAVALFLVAIVVNALRGRREAGRWRRLVRRYPAAPSRDGVRVWGDVLIFGRTGLRNATWLEIDREHLHVCAAGPLRWFRRPFSIPLADITATRGTWGLIAQPIVRLDLADNPELGFMLRGRTFERLAVASQGRLRLVE